MISQRKKQTSFVAGLVAAAVLFAGMPAAADEWNARTELTFTESIMIPGATLAPGTYIFQVSDTSASRHLVRVFKKNDREPIALTQAVPIKRSEPIGDTMLTFNPTAEGIPALKAWYYSNSSYGHEFVYSDEQARQIAERSRTIVLSVDVPESDLQKGTVRVYHPSGERTEWRGDPDTMREWDTWQRNRAVVRTSAADSDQEDDDTGNEARAPIMMTDPVGSRVALDELESNPSKYTGRTITVDAEVEEVYGPRLFTIDEPRWGDLDGEILVYAPSMLAALVNDDDLVTISGTLKTVALADVEREWGWFELDPEVEVDFMNKPVLVATRIVGGNDDVAKFIAIDDASATDKSTITTGGGAIMDPGLVGAGSADLVGRMVDLDNVQVLRPARGGGFFVDMPGGAVLVLPAHNLAVTAAPGERVSLQGAVAAVPDRIEERVNPPAGWNRQIYVVATEISK